MQYASRPSRTSLRSGGAAAESSSRRPEGRRERLFDDLVSLFLAEGFLHLTTDEIARRLRCSKTTLYQVAPSREQLYAAVVDHYLASLRASGIAAARAASGWHGALVALLGAAVTAAREASWNFVRDMRLHPASSRRLMLHQRQRVADLERLIEAGVGDGAFHDVHPRMVAELILALMGKVFEPDLLASVGLSLAEAYDETYRIIEFGLIPRSGAKAPPLRASNARGRSTVVGRRLANLRERSTEGTQEAGATRRREVRHGRWAGEEPKHSGTRMAADVPVLRGDGARAAAPGRRKRARRRPIR